MDHTTILAMDQAVRNSGWCLWQVTEQPALGAANGVIDRGVISAPRKSDGVEAARYQLMEFIAMLDAHQPSVVALEGVQLTSVAYAEKKEGQGWGKNIKIALQLSELRGMLLGAAIQRGIPVVGVSSAEVCGFLGLAPNTRRPIKKQRAQWYALTVLYGHSGAFDHPIEDAPEDEADAIIIALVAQSKLPQIDARLEV